jgi:hypothetical protein
MGKDHRHHLFAIRPENSLSPHFTWVAVAENDTTLFLIVYETFIISLIDVFAP